MSAPHAAPSVILETAPPVESSCGTSEDAARGAASHRKVVSAGQLGLNPLAWRLISVQACLIVASGALYRSVGLSIAWPTVVPYALALAVLALAWLVHYGAPGKPSERILAETLLIVLLLLLVTCIVSPAQYAAVALKRPLVDRWLAAADAWLRIDVRALAAWTSAHTAVSWVLTLAYASLGPQLLLVVLVLGLMKRERTAVWELCFHYHFCLILTLLSLAVFPAACAFDYYGFTSTLDQTRFTTQFHALRAGTFSTIRFNELEGLISMPSFHAACGLMLTWSCRRYTTLFLCLASLNSLMLAATFMSGAHYVVDVIATLPLFVGSVMVYRRWCAHWLTEY